MNRTKPLTGELLRLKEEILGYAKGYGLDFYEVIFEICDYDTINILAALSGFPNRYPHWKFGMDYDQMNKGYTYGLQRIYEMVVNTDPCYAYLLSSNNIVDQKNVMAHVYGHADFFKNNAWFKNTNRKMMDVFANHGTKIRRYMEKYGQDAVEVFIDKVLSIDNLLDANELFKTSIQKTEPNEKEIDLIDDQNPVLRSFLKSKDRWENKDKVRSKFDESKVTRTKFPDRPERDIMKFLAEEASIEVWQSDIIGILREEAYYFLPQRMTKIMNEGWASYWHSKIMTEKALLPSEIIDFADHHAGVMAMSKKRLNPYKVGIELFRDIEYRWDTGRFGKEYNECTDMKEKYNWDKKLGKGLEKIFDVRKNYNDITFIDEFLTPEFCERQQIFTYKYNPRTGRNEIDSRDFIEIKNKLLLQLTNWGTPVIEVVDGNYANRGELLLSHRQFGIDLDMNYANETMKNIYYIWKRPINLETISEDKKIILHCDGESTKILS